MNSRDRSKMKYMGYTHKAYFKNSHGVPFCKDFENLDKLEAFKKSAEEVGTELVKIETI